MKRKSKLKKFLIVLVSLVLAGAAVAGIYLYSGTTAEPVNVYSFNYVGMTEYWGDSQESYGFVQTDRVQTVFLSTTQTVTEILVAPGDQVKKGDVLLTFDTTLSDLAVERKRLGVEKLKLQLDDAKAQLRKINAMKPMVIPKPSEDKEEDKNLGTALKEAYRISSQSRYDGSSPDKAMICWLNSSTPITDEILADLLKWSKKFQEHNAMYGSEGGESSDEEQPTEPAPIQVNKFYVVFKVTSGNMSLGSRTLWQGIIVSVESDGGFGLKFYDAGSFADHSLPPDEEPPTTPPIDYGSGFTAAQIAEMRSQQEKTIKDLEFNIKMAETDYKIMLTEINDGKVYAEVDGTVVSLLTEEEAQMTGLPLLKVSGGGGFQVEGTISELSRDEMTIGTEVTVNDWRSGMVYTGTIQSIGDYPSSQNGWNGMGNPAATYYPFTVFVAEDADLQSGSYVSITYSAGTSENGIYLENPFLRTENGKSYVYVRGADGNLEQRFVTTGKSLWGSYTEILSGLSAEDFLAFPYGTEVKPGVPTREAEIRELYE